MLDPAVRTRIREHVEAELNPRERTLGVTLRGHQSNLAARGLIGGSAAYIAYANVGRDELAVRAQIIWAAIHRAHASMVRQATATTLTDIRQQLDEFIAEHRTRVLRQVLERVGVVRDATGKAHVEEEIGTRSRELMAQFDVEAQYYVAELERAAAAAPAGAAATYNFNAPVASVQTGSYATAHVSIGGADGERLREALAVFARAIEQNGEIVSESRAQALDLVNDTVAAVSAAKPNAPKIAGLLGGLSNVVRTVASLRPAYETLRDVAIAIGFFLQ